MKGILFVLIAARVIANIRHGTRNLMAITILKITLPIVFSLLILPLLVRFLIGRIILVLVRHRYISDFSQDIFDNTLDREAVLKLEAILLKKLSSPFITEYDYKEDLISIILAIQNCYREEASEELLFHFSVSDLIKSYFFLMSDLNKLVDNSLWFKKIKKTKLSTFQKIKSISGSFNYLYNKIPFLKLLKKLRIAGKILRLLLIPILGLPSIIFGIVVSINSLFFTEILGKYYYSVLLIKCAYYSMVLYGRKESILKDKIKQFNLNEIKEMANSIEDLIDLKNDMTRSDLFEESYMEFQNILKKFQLFPENDIDFDGVRYSFNKKSDVVKKIFKIHVNAVNQYNPLHKKSYSDWVQLQELVIRIGQIYSAKKKFYDDLRILDLYEVFYMISVLSYSKLLFGSKILDNLSVDFVLKAKRINDDIFIEFFRNKFPAFKHLYRSLKMIRKGHVVYRAIRSVNPVGLVLSVSGPIAFESVKIQMRDYIYHGTGRLAIYCYESNRLKRDCVFKIPKDI